MSLIPLAYLPEKAKSHYEHYEARLSIATIEDILHKDTTGTLRVSTSDLAVALSTDVYLSQNCIKTWAEFPTGHLVELLN